MIERIDAAILYFVQRYIADPLQVRGVSLMVQFCVFSAMSAVGCIAMLTDDAMKRKLGMSALDGFMLLSQLVRSLWPDWPDGIHQRRKRLTPRCEYSMRNPEALRDSGWRLLYASIGISNVPALWNHIDLQTVGLTLWWSFLALACYIDACDPKPPRPRRVAVPAFQFSTASAK